MDAGHALFIHQLPQREALMAVIFSTVGLLTGSTADITFLINYATDQQAGQANPKQLAG